MYMFFVFNKRKIGSYLISIGTVAILFSIALFGEHFGDGEKNVIATSASNVNNLPVYKVETEIKKVSLSINCGENVENIDSILNTLTTTNAKATFFISGEIASSNAEIIKKIVQSGNEIGNLSYHYTNLKKKKTADIKEEITKGNFREDLYHRLSVIIINVPSLRERKEDIEDLIAYFISEICTEMRISPKTMTPEAIELMKSYEWSGNIRELRNVVERLIILCGPVITAEDLKQYK